MNFEKDLENQALLVNDDAAEEPACWDYCKCSALLANSAIFILGILAGCCCCCLGYLPSLACLKNKPKLYVYIISVSIGLCIIILLLSVLCMSAVASGGSCVIQF